MTDLLQGLTSGTWAFVFPWIFPVFTASAIFRLVVLPRIEDVSWFVSAHSLTGSEQGILMLVSAFLLGGILNALSTPMYRLLEGYVWPESLRRKATQKQRKRKSALSGDLDRKTGWEKALQYETVQRYPADDDQVAPTRLGNALRAFETYGYDRFKLDSQALWTELLAVTAEPLRTEYDGARSGVDFFVNSTYVSMLFACLSAGLLVARPDPVIGAGALVGFLTARLSYKGAVSASHYWGECVRGIVNVGRAPLAAAFGLELPPSHEMEREMWELVAAMRFYEYKETDSEPLDRFRTRPPERRPGAPKKKRTGRKAASARH